MFNPNVTPYTPGNIDETTRMLIGLKQKGQLQQYVQQHSQDPNLVALALYVNNLDNAARGAQAQQQMQPQPTVVEERLAQMAPQQLPENVGIGALPVQGMDSFADGGIVGYADGGMGYNPASGPAGRLAYDNEPVLRMADGGIVAFDEGGYVFNPDTGEYEPEVKRKGLFESLAEQFGAGKKIDPLADRPEVKAALKQEIARRAGVPVPTPEAPPQSGLDIGGPGSSPTSWGNKGVASLLPPTGGGKQPPAPPRAAPAAAPAAAAPSSIADQIKSFREALGIKDETFDRDAEMARRQEYLGEHPAKAQLERLSKLDQMAKAEREDAFNMSLLRAGLAMMASKSPFALVGIGEGATKGVESYEDALKSLKAAEREREKMRMDVESAAYAARSNDLKSVDDKYNSFLTRREQNADRLASVYGTLKSAEMHVKGQENAARISAGAMPPNIRAAMMLGTGKTDQERLESGMAKLNALSGEKPELAFAQLYAKHVAEAQKNMTEPMSPTEFARLMRSASTAFRPQVVDTDNPSGKLYSRQ